MDFTFLNEYFVAVVMAACLAVGYIVKYATFFKWLNNDDIPVVLACFGAVLNGLVSGFTVEYIVYGAIMGLASTGLHQSFKRWVDGENKDA